MNFARARLANEGDEAATGRTAHEGIIDDDTAFALEHFAHRVVLDAHAEIATLLRRMNERASDVVIANESELECNAAFFRVSKCRRIRRVRYTDHTVCVSRL